ncbi:MAG: hypothetical protein KatS3mg057_0535 [Herpetosiphonaceae bacterium]|nr:MAG: hypothetical protein KatS3mg057_0535 [Herpetosiphonaceae bacterium]
MRNQRQTQFETVATLRQALRHIFGDRRWPIKVIIGGALSTTILGMPFSQGFLIESMDNSRRGFPTPLPPWAEWSTKYVLGVLGFVIDFIYFIAPILFAGVLLFCVATFELLTASGATIITLVPPIAGLIVILVSFSFSFSPVAKLILTEDGDLEKALSGKPIRHALSRPARGIYARARLATLPGYLPALAAALLFWEVISTSSSLGLAALAFWLLNSTLLFAHLIVVQIYTVAAGVVRRVEFEARLAEREQVSRGGH